jgi:hypothetical protein
VFLVSAKCTVHSLVVKLVFAVFQASAYREHNWSRACPERSGLRPYILYASTGVEIEELYVEDCKVHIKTSPCKQISLITDKRFKAARSVNGDLAKAVLSIASACKAFYVLCEDTNGKIAAPLVMSV